jgi:Flp pilus assembly protein TadG
MRLVRSAPRSPAALHLKGGFRLPHRRGQALVEFAIILPLLLLILTGILQFGVLLSGQIALVNGVREAARYGSVLQTASSGAATANGAQVGAQLTSVLADGLPGYSPANLTAHSTCYIGYTNPGSTPTSYSVRLTVSATYKHPLFVPIVAQILDVLDGSADGGFTLHASEQFRVENPPIPAPDPLPTQVCVSTP